MKKIFFTVFSVCMIISNYAQNHIIENLEINDFIDGTLLQPEEKKSKTLAIIIAGSGSTDRDGNQIAMKNNSLKQLAYFLADQGVASFRYDKRIIKLSRNQKYIQSQIRFEDFVDDAADVVNYFKLFEGAKYGFDKFILIGHSQGALVAQLASLKTAVNGLILLCGTAKPIDEVMVSQISKQAPFLYKDLKEAFDSIKKVGYVKAYNPLLKTVLREDTQAFLQSWMQYNPKAIAKKITEYTLVVGGTTDIQVPGEEAKILSESFPNADYAIIDNMNHVLKEVKSIGLENQKAYNNPNLPLHQDLKSEIEMFLQNFK
ncbi:MAG: alpha/beta fold hydrolase [Bacteroidetes bacterium]|jgi:predicted esterase|nr:alpha/beta fold hydrolase [Bacteroidota bacterium]